MDALWMEHPQNVAVYALKELNFFEWEFIFVLTLLTNKSRLPNQQAAQEQTSSRVS